MTVVSLDAHRTLTLGGSEAAAACGVDPYRSRIMLWAEKSGFVQREPNEAMAWGTLLEPVIAAELERRGYALAPAPADGFRDEERPWLVGHPDGFAELDGELALLEIKTAGAWAGREWHEDAGAPPQYLMQLHHYFELTGYSLALLACLVAGQRLEVRVVRRDDAVIARMLELEGEFLDYLRRDVPPPPDGSRSSGDALLALYPQSNGGVVRLDKIGWGEYRELKARREQRAAIDRQAEELEQRLKLRMGEAETAISPHDETAAKWTTYERTALDTAWLKAERPDLFAAFSKTTPLRRFTLE